MALFRNYEKPGPGVDPDEPEKGPILGFFQAYFSKFWRVCGLSLLAVVTSLPTLALLFFLSSYFLPMLFPALSYDSIYKVVSALDLTFTEGVNAATYTSHLYLSTLMIFTFTVFSLQYFVIGPFHTGITFIIRNFATHKPVFFWSDFWEAVKANWKQSLIHSIISSLAFALLIFSYYFYPQVLSGFGLYLIRAFIIVVGILFIVMNFYIYQMMITFDLKLTDIYKNSFILALSKVPSAFAIVLILALLLVVIPFLLIWNFPNIGVAVIIFIVYISIFVGFAYFLINYYASRGIKKYMIDPLNDDDDDDDDNQGKGSMDDLKEDKDISYESKWHYTEEVPQKQDNSDDGEVPAGSPA